MSSPDLTNAIWRTARRSSGNGQCVEIANLPGIVAVRDSKDPDGPALVFKPAAFAAFVEGLKADRL